ncbi:TetR/AcrR family transcriptional regulator [Parapedomonas caeni]|jgi:AcrR family transcriptional regulator
MTEQRNAPKPRGRRLALVRDDTPGDDAASPYSGPYARTFDRRRQDILATAWEMIAERGDDDINLAELSKRSGVALRTIYNAFTDKEGVIAQCLATHYHTLFDGIEIGVNDSRSLREAIEMMGRVAADTIRVRAFSGCAARLYFSSRTSPKLTEGLRRLPISTLKAWMRSDEADRRTIQHFGRDEIERSFANVQWGLVNDWATGQIDDHDFTRGMKNHMVMVALAFGNRAGRAAAKSFCGLLDD